MLEFFKKMLQRIERYFWNEKENLPAIENKAQQLNERIDLYRQILASESHSFCYIKKIILTIYYL